MNTRVEGYDFIRSIVILVVFLGHILDKQATSEAVLLATRSLSPGLTMSLLGFLSAVLLSAREYDFGTFLIKRFTRIYISLAFCLTVVLAAHFMLGKGAISQHTLLHFIGLSAFFELFLVPNKASIGAGLWFITVIVLMYLLFPLLQRLFKHRRGFLHLLLLVGACTLASFVTYVTPSVFNVIISFSIGLYLGANGHIQRLTEIRPMPSLLCSIGLLALVALATAEVLPFFVRNLLFAFYPLAFVPLLLAISRKLSPAALAASGFFAGLSYEFYILHFYLINEQFADFFPASTPLAGQILVSFITTLVIAYLVSNAATRFRVLADRYLLAS